MKIKEEGYEYKLEISLEMNGNEEIEPGGVFEPYYKGPDICGS